MIQDRTFLIPVIKKGISTKEHRQRPHSSKTKQKKKKKPKSKKKHKLASTPGSLSENMTNHRKEQADVYEKSIYLIPDLR